MSLQIKSAGELQELVEELGLKVKSLDDLQELLLITNQGQVSPEIHREFLEARERRLEQKRDMEHAERMRALEMGYDPQTTDTLSKITAKASESAGWIGSVVPLGLAGIAIGATAVVKGKLDSPELFLAALAIIWGTSAFVAIAALAFCHFTLRYPALERLRRRLTEQNRQSQRLPEEYATGIQAYANDADSYS